MSSRRFCSFQLMLLITIIFCSIKYLSAAPAGQITEPTYEPGVLYLPDRAISVQDGYELSIQGVFGGMVLICTGLLLSFRSLWDTTVAGHRTQGLSGFIALGFITWVMLANFEPSGTYGTNRQTIYFLVPLIVGLLAIFVMSVTIQLYLMLLGGFGGLAFGLWVLGWKNDLSITSNYGRAVLLTVLVVVFMLLSLYHHRVHMTGAALAGPYIFFMGLDIYFHTGFLYCFTTTLDSNHKHEYQMYTGVYIMQSCLIVAFIVVYAVQSVQNVRFQHQFLMETYLNNPNYRKPTGPIGPIGHGYHWSQWAQWRPGFLNRGQAVPPPAPIVNA